MEIPKSQVTIRLKAYTQEEEDKILERFKQIGKEELRKFDLEICGPNKTLNYEFDYQKVIDKQNKENNAKNTTESKQVSL